MPKKSVREMSNIERAHYSLSARMFHATIMGSIILGVIALLIGFGLYSYALVQQYVGDAFNLSRSAETILRRVVYVEPMVDTVMDTYHNMSVEERAQVGTEEYRSHFREITELPEYQTVITLMDTFREASDVNDIYLAVYDRDTSALVYIADPETEVEFICNPGDWEPVRQKELDKFLNWDGTGRLYDISNEEKYGWICTAGVPIVTEQGKTIAFVLADVTLHEVAAGMKNFLIQYFIAMFVVINLFAILLTHHMKKTLVDPINAIAGAAQEYVQDRRAGQQVTDRFAMLNIRTGDEVENLSLVMADMERELSEYVDHLTAITAEKERINTELDLARRIQADMLPSIFPPFPERSDFDIYASMDPAKEVGGDFYDFFLVDDHSLGFAIADVSGKGIPAALFMMIAKNLVQNFALTIRDPAEVLRAVNEQICKNNHEEMFITIWFGILDLNTGELTAANAGHEYPVLMKPYGEFEVLKDRHCFVVGGMETAKYHGYSLKLEPGSKLFLYTDGVPEATNNREELFGTDRMLHALNDAKDEKPEAILRRVDRAVEYFVSSADQFDDKTMLCLEYIGQAKEKNDDEGTEH